MRGQFVRTLVAAGVIACVVTVTAAVSAEARISVGRFDSSLTRTQAAGVDPVADGRAGAHSDLNVNIRWPSEGRFVGDESPRDVTVQLPPGVLGDPSATPKCSQEAFEELYGGDAICPAASQVGLATFKANPFNDDDPAGETQYPRVAIFNLEPRRPDEVARLGFSVATLVGARVYISIQPRTEGDYGLEAKVEGLTRLAQVTEANLALWGVPGDPVHDPERYGRNGDQDPQGGPVEVRPNPGGARNGFITAPTRCFAALPVSLAATSYEDPDNPFLRSALISTGLTRCDEIPFEPAARVEQRDTTQADAPAGYDITVSVPQAPRTAPTVASHLRRAQVTLPEGVALNPPVAYGLQACGDADLRSASREAATCPNGAKIASASIQVPILGGALEGGLYVRPQTAEETYRVALVASGFGVNVKLPGVVRPDPSTGRLTAIFDQTPQVPFSDVSLRIDGGSRAVLANPVSCGGAAASSVFSPWSGTGDVTSVSAPLRTSWDGAGAPCPARLPFAPRLDGGSESSVSGRTSPFTIRLSRDDRNLEIGSLGVAPPLGLTAIVKGVPLCPLTNAAAGTCSRSSRIGSVRAGAGAGPTPYFVGGDAYLTKGYKGAPYGMAFVVPVVAGPFDLGTVVVQAKVDVDVKTAQLRITSDPFPRIVNGVPLRIRDVQVAIDRPRFTLNPTNCKAQSIEGRVTPIGGPLVAANRFFQATGCSRQYYKPRIALGLRGKGATRDGSHPALAAVVEQRRGSANISKVRATLPSSLALDPDNAQTLCEFEAGQRSQCPRGSIVGRAKITTPLLNKPLRGPVYFVKNVRRNKFGRLVRTLPTLLITLRGEIALDLRASTSVAGGKNLVTTFSSLPDQPFSRFDLYLNGGSNGILAANTNLCRQRPLEAGFETDAQNGKRSDPEVRMGTPCR